MELEVWLILLQRRFFLKLEYERFSRVLDICLKLSIAFKGFGQAKILRFIPDASNSLEVDQNEIYE
jgi:hypothetical protein